MLISVRQNFYDFAEWVDKKIEFHWNNVPWRAAIIMKFSLLMIVEKFMCINNEYASKWGCQSVPHISLGELKPETAVK